MNSGFVKCLELYNSGVVKLWSCKIVELYEFRSCSVIQTLCNSGVVKLWSCIIEEL